MSRQYFDVKWKASEALWMVKRRNVSGSSGILAYREKKSDAVALGAMEARLHWVNNREPSELTVFRQDGAICVGTHGRRSYPRHLDPRRSKG